MAAFADIDLQFSFSEFEGIKMKATAIQPQKLSIKLTASDLFNFIHSLYLFVDIYLHSGEYHLGTVGIDIRNYIFGVLPR